jgi:ribosome-associated protein
MFGTSANPGDSREQLAPGVFVRPEHLDYSFVRSSGPGGQAVNKLNTAVQLRVAIGAIEGLTGRAVDRLRRMAGQRLTNDDELLIQAQTHRSQLENRRACLQRLRHLVTEAVREPKRRKKTRPSRAMIERRLKQKKEQSEKKSRRRWSPDA